LDLEGRGGRKGKEEEGHSREGNLLFVGRICGDGNGVNNAFLLLNKKVSDWM